MLWLKPPFLSVPDAVLQYSFVPWTLDDYLEFLCMHVYAREDHNEVKLANMQCYFGSTFGVLFKSGKLEALPSEDSDVRKHL